MARKCHGYFFIPAGSINEIGCLWNVIKISGRTEQWGQEGRSPPLAQPTLASDRMIESLKEKSAPQAKISLQMKNCFHSQFMNWQSRTHFA